jgi:hypothetical protein
VANKLDRNQIDVVQVWNAYMTFDGCTLKAALACDLPEETVARLADEDNWPAKIKSLSKFSAINQRSVAQQINRAANFMQGHRLRQILDKVIKEISESPEAFKEFTQVYQPGGGIGRSTKNLTDLARAVEITHAVTMRALGDTPQEVAGQSSGKVTDDQPLTALGAEVVRVLSRLDSGERDAIKLVKETVSDASKVQSSLPEEGS